MTARALTEPAMSAADTRVAMLNVLEDFAVERERASDVQSAVLNILEDAAAGQAENEGTHKAVLNVLEDFAAEHERAATVHEAVVNVLDDFFEEKERLESAQRAVLNILDDVDLEQRRARAANDGLRQEMAERVRAEAALEDRTAALARSNDELEMFAYAASHDLSEPLRAISGPVSLLARRYAGALDDEADQLIGFAVDGCERMQTLINDLLALSRVGRTGGEPVLVPLDTTLGNVVAMLAPTIEAIGAVVTHDALPIVRGEPQALAQVLQNLVSNAVKYIDPARVPQVHVAARSEHGRWRITVADNGIGIAPRHRERVFGMFKRLHTRDEYPGTGIGLALCKKIVEHHGGTIGVDDGPEGQGSTFWFTLPIDEEEIR